MIKPAREMAAALERTHIMVATAEPVHKMSATTMPQVTADLPESSKVPVDRHESNQVTAEFPKSRHISADRPESRHITADCPESRHVAAVRPESHHVTAECPESHHVSSVRPESLHSLSVASGAVLQYPRLTSSMEDPPLSSVRAAGIPKPAPIPSSPSVPELILLSVALPIMGIAL